MQALPSTLPCQGLSTQTCSAIRRVDRAVLRRPSAQRLVRPVRASMQQRDQVQQAAAQVAGVLAAAALALQPLPAAAEELPYGSTVFDPMAYSGRWYEVASLKKGACRAGRRCGPLSESARSGAACRPAEWRTALLRSGKLLAAAGFAGEGQADCHGTQVRPAWPLSPQEGGTHRP